MPSSWWPPPARPRKLGLHGYQRFIQYGASPRASIAMIEAGRALAFMRGRDYVLPADVVDVAADVLRHRLVPSYEALSEGMTADQIWSRGSCAPCRRPRSAGDHVACRQRLKHVLRRLELPVIAAAGRPAAGRLPDAVPRRRPGSGRSARIPVSRRCPPHRLERHRAPGDALCARLSRGPGNHGLVPAGHEPLDDFEGSAFPSTRC